MKLDADGARRGIKEKIADPLKLDTIAAAQAIVEIAIAKMSLAVREVSVAKGYDPRDFALVASGGAGPLHVVAIARELYIPKVVVPLFPSHFSALGMLLADERHDFIRTFYSDLATVDFATLVEDPSTRWSRKRRASLRHAADAERQIHLDLRYVGQEFTLQVPVSVSELETGDRGGIRAAFDALYEHRYAHHSPDEPVEMVNIRLGDDRQAPEAGVSEARRDRRGEAVATARGLFQRRAQGAGLPGLPARDARRRKRDRRPGADPGARHDDGLFEQDACTVAPSGELIITVGAA